MSERAPYSRVYWTVRNDPRLADIYCDDHHWATWNRLLLAADMAWPAPADLPGAARRASVAVLVSAGVIEVLPGGLFRFHGLDAERGRRKEAATRLGMGLPPNRDPDATQQGPRGVSSHGPKPSLVKDETSITPLPPSAEGGPSRANGTNPRAVAAALTRTANQAAKERKARQHQRYIAYSRGKITEAQRIEMDEADTPLSQIPGWAS